MGKYKIVKRLEYCAENKCDICQEENGSGFPWIDGRCYGFTERLYDALALLKEQEPKIISLTDVVCAEDGSIVWLETYFDGNTVIEPFLVCVDFTQKPVIINGWNSFINVHEKELEDSIISIISDRYEVRKFRFWSAWPTKAQREAVKWK